MEHYLFLLRLIICIILSFIVGLEREINRSNAGIIAIDGNKVKAINTAATVWCVAAIGILIGLKLIFEAITGTFAVVFTNIFVKKIKNIFFPERTKDNDI